MTASRLLPWQAQKHQNPALIRCSLAQLQLSFFSMLSSPQKFDLQPPTSRFGSSSLSGSHRRQAHPHSLGLPSGVWLLSTAVEPSLRTISHLSGCNHHVGLLPAPGPLWQSKEKQMQPHPAYNLSWRNQRLGDGDTWLHLFSRCLPATFWVLEILWDQLS